MNNNMSFYEFIDSPDTVDFVIRQNDYLTKYINDNPAIITTQTLMGGYVIAYTNTEEFNFINNIYGASIYSWLSNVLGLLDYESLINSGITSVQEAFPYSLTGRGVLMGFVDTGIDYTQEVFKYEDGTSRIQFIYDQTVNGNPPEGFYIGTEYSNAQINQALTAENQYDIVPQQDTSGHGTFLASVAAGRRIDGYIGAAPDTELIAVKLKKARPYYLDMYSVPENQENAYESSDVMAGVEYILRKARELGRPVVICLGLGSNFGSHDGFSLFEEYLNSVSILKGVCLCNAAGNEYQARHHMEGIIPSAGASVNIDVAVGADAGDVVISIWNRVSEMFAISVRSPEGEMVEKFAVIPGKINETNLILSRSGVRVVYYFPLEGSGNQITMVKLINASPGVWTLIIHGEIVLDGIFHAWLPLTNFVLSRCALFNDKPL
ncbi:MAG: S8 family peptidase [Eubacteriales bacterium]